MLMNDIHLHATNGFRINSRAVLRKLLRGSALDGVYQQGRRYWKGACARRGGTLASGVERHA